MLHNYTDDFEKVCPNFQFMINGAEPEYLIFRGKFRVLEYFGSVSNNAETKPKWYAVIVILEQEITIEKLDASHILPPEIMDPSNLALSVSARPAVRISTMLASQ